MKSKNNNNQKLKNNFYSNFFHNNLFLENKKIIENFEFYFLELKLTLTNYFLLNNFFGSLQLLRLVIFFFFKVHISNIFLTDVLIPVKNEWTQEEADWNVRYGWFGDYEPDYIESTFYRLEETDELLAEYIMLMDYISDNEKWDFLYSNFYKPARFSIEVNLATNVHFWKYNFDYLDFLFSSSKLISLNFFQFNLISFIYLNTGSNYHRFLDEANYQCEFRVNFLHLFFYNLLLNLSTFLKRNTLNILQNSYNDFFFVKYSYLSLIFNKKTFYPNFFFFFILFFLYYVFFYNNFIDEEELISICSFFMSFYLIQFIWFSFVSYKYEKLVSYLVILINFSSETLNQLFFFILKKKLIDLMFFQFYKIQISFLSKLFINFFFELEKLNILSTGFFYINFLKMLIFTSVFNIDLLQNSGHLQDLCAQLNDEKNYTPFQTIPQKKFVDFPRTYYDETPLSLKPTVPISYFYSNLHASLSRIDGLGKRNPQFSSSFVTFITSRNGCSEELEDLFHMTFHCTTGWQKEVGTYLRLGFNYEPYLKNSWEDVRLEEEEEESDFPWGREFGFF